MRHILEQKSLKEIKDLEQKVMNPHVSEEDWLVEILTGKKCIWLMRHLDQNFNKNAIHIENNTEEKIDTGLNSPTEEYNIMKQVLVDPLKCPIKEDVNEQSIKETSLNTSKVNALTNVHSTLNKNPFNIAKGSLSSEKEMYSDRTTLIKNFGNQK